MKVQSLGRASCPTVLLRQSVKIGFVDTALELCLHLPCFLCHNEWDAWEKTPLNKVQWVDRLWGCKQTKQVPSCVAGDEPLAVHILKVLTPNTSECDLIWERVVIDVINEDELQWRRVGL